MTFTTALVALGLVLQQPQIKVDLPAQYKSPVPAMDSVVARVDGVEIKASDLAPFLWDWRAEEALSDLISYQMAKAEADAMGVKVEPAEIEAEIATQRDQVKQGLQPGQDLDTVLRAQGFPPSRLYLRVASQLMVDKLMMRRFDPKEYVKVSTIVVKPESEQAAALTAALKVADEVYGRLQKGESWDSVLASVPDPTGKPSGGPVGWRPLSAFPDSVREAFGKIEAGKVTAPVQTTFGIQIFRLEMHGKSAQGADLEALRDAYKMGARQSYATQLRERVKVEKLLRGGT